jgi:hypothetical protein
VDAKPFAQTEDLEHDPFSLCSGVLAGFNRAFGSLAVGNPRLPGEREDSAQGTTQ